ncbi:OmpW family protein [Shinella curvata]|uniref:OmpW family protein n=1 Tax=Shinella curvata TaxID=1817964 RepID=A0ABT8XE05_9HYPH|nr:OmpW family protein [Shinella curvata]MCJ8055557.1 OmpW family protein [Shinella curvata]MDO6121974.1 OmpW family protein [Shinella curvata]
MKKSGVVLGAVVLGLAACGGPALAADLEERMAPPEAAVDFATQSPWQVRVRGLGVITSDKGFVDGIAGSGLSYSDTVVPELDISYFFTDNIAAELILGTTYANIEGDGSIAGLGKVGKTWLLPPTVTLQYHFTDFGAFKPYVGAGVNYTLFYNQSGSGAFTNLDVKNKFGAALQVGFDYMLDKHWGVNFDVKKLFLEPEWKVDFNGAPLTGKAKLNPWLVGAGVTYRF